MVTYGLLGAPVLVHGLAWDVTRCIERTNLVVLLIAVIGLMCNDRIIDIVQNKVLLKYKYLLQ